MRWVFMSLLAANLALAGWYWWVDDTGVEVRPVAEMKGGAITEIELLGEVEAQERVVGVPESRLRMPSDSAVEGEALCSMVGPFKEMLPAEYFVEHLQALEVRGVVERLEVSSGAGFWVYQEPRASKKEALRRLHELQAAGLDSYVIPKGELENGVSFGFFSERRGAEARLAEVRELGYEVLLKEIARSYEEIWVVLGVQESAKVGDELWLTLLNREAGLEMRQNYCPGVAHEGKFI